MALALIAISLLWLANDLAHWAAFFLTAFVIYSDALDGYLARKLKQVSTFGGKLDIAGDRVVEMVYWISFTSLGWIHIFVPLLFLVRGNFVDVIRAQAGEEGLTAFGEKTMMTSSWGKFLVSSNFSRFTYAVAKATAFCLMIASHTQACRLTIVPNLALAFVYISCAFCIIRGLPVLIEGRSIIGKLPSDNQI